MIVFNLRCNAQHLFEGWFRSPEDYHRQRERELVSCPICASTSVERLLSAPRLNLSAASEAPTAAAPLPPIPAEHLRRLRRWLGQAENVGEKFVEEARRIHYQEAPSRTIRGQASRDDYSELLDEGILVLPVPDGVVPDGELN